MTVRREIAQSPRGSEVYLKQYVDRSSGEPACLDAGHFVQACRSGKSAIAAEALMNNAGYVKTVVEMGWGGVKNGALLVLAAKEFDAFLTVGKNLPYQQNVANLPVAVIVLEAYSNELGALLPTRSQPGASI